MSLGRLLAAGKSLVGLHGGPGRYRTNKKVRLPKFISPKNPFATGEAPAKPPGPAPGSAQPVAPKPVAVAVRTEASGAGQETLRAPKSARVGGWLRAWGQKLKPLPRAARTFAATKPAAQQGELSLDGVRVVRNDLSDGDFAAGRPTGGKPVLPVMVLTAEKLEPVGAAWQRLTTKFFGSDHH